MPALRSAAAILLPLVWSAVALMGADAERGKDQDGSATQRETVLDRKAHIEAGITKEVPEVPPLCDGIVGLAGKPVDIGDGKLYCEEEGQGVQLVLLNGGPGCTHHIFHPAFSRAKEFARVIYYDQRGTGRSDADGSGEKYTVKQAVDDLDNLRKALHVDRWVVLGHSYGGFLAQCYALEYPERLLGLVLVAASTGARDVETGTRQYEYISKEEMAKIRSIFATKDLPPDVLVYNAHLNGDWKRQAYYRPTLDELARMARYEWKPAPGFREAIGPDMSRIDLTGKFSDFEVPTLMIEAKWDLTWAADKPEKFHKNHPNARLVVFEQSGHSPFADESEKFFTLLREFAIGAQEGAKALRKRSGNRIAWPSPVVRKVDRLPWTGAGKQAVEVYVEATKAELADSRAWHKLGVTLYDGKNYDEALEALRRAEKSSGSDVFRSFVALVWQGHILDLLGRREEALDRYKTASNLRMQGAMRCDQYGIVIDQNWVKERIEKPFQRK
ncbi:MAG: alpha/beta fold hydrolase [Planctomycetota bacterium]|nr:alpha/beta fold hydrolase [Planctomycetota bacterium]